MFDSYEAVGHASTVTFSLWLLVSGCG